MADRFHFRRPWAPDKKIAHAEVGYFFDSGGEDGNRTRLNGFAGRIAGLRIKHLRENLPIRLPNPFPSVLQVGKITSACWPPYVSRNKFRLWRRGRQQNLPMRAGRPQCFTRHPTHQPRVYNLSVPRGGFLYLPDDRMKAKSRRSQKFHTVPNVVSKKI